MLTLLKWAKWASIVAWEETIGRPHRPLEAGGRLTD